MSAYLTGSQARALVERIKAGDLPVWARMRSGRSYHAKVSNTATAAFCGATPSDGPYSGWWNDNTKRPERRGCVDCLNIVDEAIEAAK